MTDMRNSFTLSRNYQATCHDRRVRTRTAAAAVLVGSSGNPYLKPFKAKALDLSYEKYFANKRGLPVSGALFYKKLDTYIVPYYRPGVRLHRRPRSAVGITVPPPETFTYRGPVHVTTVNGSGGNLKGFELTAQIPFSMFTQRTCRASASTAASPTPRARCSLPNVDRPQNPTQPAGRGPDRPLPGLSHLNKKVMIVFREVAASPPSSPENSRSEYIGSVANNDRRRLPVARVYILTAALGLGTGRLRSAGRAG